MRAIDTVRAQGPKGKDHRERPWGSWGGGTGHTVGEHKEHTVTAGNPGEHREGDHREAPHIGTTGGGHTVEDHEDHIGREAILWGTIGTIGRGPYGPWGP